MNFNQKELEYLLTCLNFHYAENDNIKEDIIVINAELCKKFSYDLNKIEKEKINLEAD